MRSGFNCWLKFFLTTAAEVEAPVNGPGAQYRPPTDKPVVSSRDVVIIDVLGSIIVGEFINRVE